VRLNQSGRLTVDCGTTLARSQIRTRTNAHDLSQKTRNTNKQTGQKNQTGFSEQIAKREAQTENTENFLLASI
jgi:hypothetical protein